MFRAPLGVWVLPGDVVLNRVFLIVNLAACAGAAVAVLLSRRNKLAGSLIYLGLAVLTLVSVGVVILNVYYLGI